MGLTDHFPHLDPRRNSDLYRLSAMKDLEEGENEMHVLSRRERMDFSVLSTNLELLSKLFLVLTFVIDILNEIGKCLDIGRGIGGHCNSVAAYISFD